MNVTELLQLLREQHDEAAAHADGLHRQLAELPAALTEADGRLTVLTTTRKIVESLTPRGSEPPAEPAADTYQQILAAFNEHPTKPCRARELHEFLGRPTDEAAVNITRSRLGRLARHGVLTPPGRGLYQKRM